MATCANGQTSSLVHYDCKIGPVSDLNVFEEDYFYILASSETNNDAVAVWPDRSTSEHVPMTYFSGHSAGIKCITCTPKSGKFFVTGSIDRTCRLWRWNSSMTSAESTIFNPSHRDASSINTVDISPDELSFAAGGKDHTISIWDINDNSKPIHATRTGGGSVSHIRFNPYNSSTFAACRRGVLIFIDKRHNFREVQTYKDPNLNVCTWEDAYHLVFASGANIRSIDTRSPNKTLNIAALKSPITGLAFDFERKTLAVTNGDGLYLFTDNYRCRKGPNPTGRVTTVAYSHLTDRLIYAKSTGEITLASHVHEGEMKSDSVDSTPVKGNTPCENKGAIESDEKRESTTEERSMSSPTRSSSSESLNNGYEEITDDTIMKTARELIRHQNDKAMPVRPIHEAKCGGKTVYTVSISPDNQSIIAGSSDRKVIYWKKGHRLTYPLPGHTGDVRATAFSPDSSYFLSGSDDCKIFYWPLSDKILSPMEITPTPLTGHKDHVKSLSIDNDGLKFCSSSSDHQVILWSCRNSRVELTKIHKVHTSMVNAVRFHPLDPKLIATASKGSGVILIDDRIPSPLIISASRDAPNLSLAWHPLNSALLATGTWTSIRIWDIRNTSHVFQFLKTPFPCTSVNYHPSGHQLIGSIINCATVKMYSCDTSSYKLEEISSINDTHSRSIWSAIFNSTGTQIVTAGGAPGRLAVWPNKFVSPLGNVDEPLQATDHSSGRLQSPMLPAEAPNNKPRRISSTSTSSTTEQTPVTILRNENKSEVKAKVALASDPSTSSSFSSSFASASTSKTTVTDAGKMNGMLPSTSRDTASSAADSPNRSKPIVSNIIESPPSNLSDSVATLLDARICPIKRTIGQLEYKLNQTLQAVKCISDSESYLKKVVATHMEVQANQNKLIQDMHTTLRVLDVKVASLSSQNNPQVYHELKDIVKKLQAEMDKIKIANAKTNSMVAELKENVNRLSNDSNDRSRGNWSFTLPFTSGFVVAAIAALSYYCVIKRKIT